MVDTPAIPIWKGCAESVASAVADFEASWSKYSDRGGRYRLGGLVKEIIKPKWEEHVKTIPKSSEERRLCESFAVIRKDGKQGFRKLERELKTLSAKLANLPREAAPCAAITLPTLDTLIEIFRACERKRPAQISLPGGRRRSSRWHNQCQLCGNHTEVGMFLQMGNLGQAETLGRKLSGKYCSSHRAKLMDGAWNPMYRRDIRKITLLKKEIEAVRQSCKPSQSNPPNEVGNFYLQRIVTGMGFHILDEDDITSVARALVDHRIDARKRTILALYSIGRTQSEIARQLSLSRQAIYKVIHSSQVREFNAAIELLTKKVVERRSSRINELNDILLSGKIERARAAVSQRTGVGVKLATKVR